MRSLSQLCPNLAKYYAGHQFGYRREDSLVVAYAKLWCLPLHYIMTTAMLPFWVGVDMFLVYAETPQGKKVMSVTGTILKIALMIAVIASMFWDVAAWFRE